MRLVKQLEGAKEQLEQWNPMLRKHVDALVMELRKQEALELVYKAEDHAQELSKKAQALQRCVCVPAGWCVCVCRRAGGRSGVCVCVPAGGLGCVCVPAGGLVCVRVNFYIYTLSKAFYGYFKIPRHHKH